MSDRKRLLNDLRVIDLRSELEKRNLDKSGVRGVLIQRLSKHLEEEGHDPATFKFELASPEPKTPLKKTRRGTDQESEEAPAMEDMVVQDDIVGDEIIKTEKDTTDADNRPVVEEKMDLDEKASRKRELKDDPNEDDAKKPCIKEIKQEEEPRTENNTDAEDSINLDLGDDELLNEENDNTAKNKNDVAAQEEVPKAAGDNEPAAETTAPNDAASAEDQQQVNTDAPATSDDIEINAKEIKEEKEKDEENDKKEKKDDNKEGGARNLWVSGLSGDTRAKDLKQLCSKHGKVIGAKVVTNARTPGSRCYGYVTMGSAQDAENCIKNLHRTELHGRMISVEKAKSESESSSRRQPIRSERRPSVEKREDSKDNDESKENEKAEVKVKKEAEASGEEGGGRSVSRSREKSHRSDKDRMRRSSRSRERRRSPREVLCFSKIWKERDDARARERSRAARDDERRRRAAEDALRDRERRQREEKRRLAVEREKLRAERERIEREKNELLRLERERHRLEREKLELERLELKRAQQRLDEERRKRTYDGGAYRKPASSPPAEPAYERDRHKRPPPPPMSSRSGQFEAPPPPRFELPASYERADKRDRERDYKRDYPRHVSSSSMKYTSNGNSVDDARQPLPPGTRPKEPGRSYESREPRSYRASPPGKPEPRWSAARYPDPQAATKSSGGGGGSGWSGEARYGYEARYGGSYQPPPPGAAPPYADRYAGSHAPHPPHAQHAPHAPHATHAPPRDYRKF